MCLHSEDIFCKSWMMKSESHTIILRIRYYHSWRARIFAFLWDFTETLYKKVTKLKNNNPDFTQKSITLLQKSCTMIKGISEFRIHFVLFQLHSCQNKRHFIQISCFQESYETIRFNEKQLWLWAFSISLVASISFI